MRTATSVLSTLACLLGLGSLAWAEETATPPAPSEETSSPAAAATEAPEAAQSPSLLEHETLTDRWFGAGDALAARGLTLNLSATQIYQANVHGGLATRRHSNRYTGSYDLELTYDLGQAGLIPGGRFYTLAEGSWRQGIGDESVGSLFNVNDDADGNRSIDVTECWYEQGFLDEKVRVRLGKIDLTGGFECHGCPVSFDGNSFANDETTQFLNSALVNNPTIPFPENGLGVIVHVEPTEWWYVSAGIGDAEADARETGFNTAFDARHYSVSLFETGLVPHVETTGGPLTGAYRVGLWYDPQPKAFWKDPPQMKRDAGGFYLRADQQVLRETADPADRQGLGVFFRFGLTDERVNPIQKFWSTGCQYQGLVPGRDDDVLGVGMARGLTNRRAGFTADNETGLAVYSAMAVAPWLTVSPHLQYLKNPGGMRESRDATVAGVRVLATF